MRFCRQAQSNLPSLQIAVLIPAARNIFGTYFLCPYNTKTTGWGLLQTGRGDYSAQEDLNLLECI